MLLSALSLACFLAANVVNGQDSCPLLGTTPLRVTEKSNYVIDYFSGQLLFTYAINKCTATSISPGSWYKYACTEGQDGTWSVTKTKYTDAACTKGASNAGSFAEGDSASGEVGYFECSGANNYVQVEVSVSPDCSSSQVVSAGLAGCTDNSPLLTEFYCDDSQGLVQLYIDPSTLTTSTEAETNDTATTYDALTTEYESTETWTTEEPELVCSPYLYCNKWTFVSECKAVAVILKNTVYGRLNKCSISSVVETSTTSTTGDNGNGNGNQSAASSLFVITNLAFALIVTLFSLF